ncbi:MAG TPA: glycosyltransferase, partial [Spirochaetia bacterium]|nr:glycosyltransferase [Spirochaetia bacterium]
MKIAFVTTGYKPRINGLTTSVESFARIFRKLGHDVTIVTSRYPCYRDIEPGIVRIKSHYLFFDPEDRLANPWLPSSRRIIRKLLDKGFDIIHTHTHFFLEMDALRWAKKIGCPVVYTYHTLFEIYVKHYAKFLPASVK